MLCGLPKLISGDLNMTSLPKPEPLPFEDEDETEKGKALLKRGYRILFNNIEPGYDYNQLKVIGEEILEEVYNEWLDTPQ